MMKDNIYILNFIAGVLFYIVFIIKIFSDNASGGVIWLCLGSAFICFGAASLSKKGKKADGKDSKNILTEKDTENNTDTDKK